MTRKTYIDQTLGNVFWFYKKSKFCLRNPQKNVGDYFWANMSLCIDPSMEASFAFSFLQTTIPDFTGPRDPCSALDVVPGYFVSSSLLLGGISVGSTLQGTFTHLPHFIRFSKWLSLSLTAPRMHQKWFYT